MGFEQGTLWGNGCTMSGLGSCQSINCLNHVTDFPLLGTVAIRVSEFYCGTGSDLEQEFVGQASQGSQMGIEQHYGNI